MTIVTPLIKLTKADVECIKKIREACGAFGITPWDIIDAVEEECGCGIVEFYYEDE